MRFHSTPQSAHNLEVTLLAIIETVVSVALFIGLGLYFGSFSYLYWAILVAPLMLLRTDLSARWGLSVFSKLSECSDRFFGGESDGNLFFFAYKILFGLFIFVPFLLPALGVIVRWCSTIYIAMRRPRMTLIKMPQNWVRQSFCVDFFHPPELLPLENVRGGDRHLRFSRFFESADESADESESPKSLLGDVFYYFLFLPPIICIGYIPSLLYRFTFKATSIVYLPLIFVAQLTLKNPLSIKARLERITKGELEKLRRWFSLVIIGGLLGKIGLAYGLVDLKFLTDKFPSQQIVDLFVLPDSWPLWQWTLVAEAGLTFFLYYFADAAISRLTEKAWSEKLVENTVEAVSFIRGLLAIAMVIYGFWVVFVEVVFFKFGVV